MVAIDGPAGAGKSTVSRLVAEKLGLDVLDTGAMYRCVAWAALFELGDVSDPADVARVAAAARVEQVGTRWIANGVDVTETIRGVEVTAAVSVVAAQPAVRARLVELQRAWLDERGGGVVEGRDIGSVVVPDACLKVYLDAEPTARATRRAREKAGGAEISERDTTAELASLNERDRLDSTRTVSPLVQAPDAVVLDTTVLSIDEVVDAIVDLWRER